jgi:hypothetical protein
MDLPREAGFRKIANLVEDRCGLGPAVRHDRACGFPAAAGANYPLREWEEYQLTQPQGQR